MKKVVANIFLLMLTCNCLSIGAQTLPPQNMDVIANFSLNEDDTTRYTGHYLFESAYQLIEDMLTDKQDVNFKEAVFAIENALLGGRASQQEYDAQIGHIAALIRKDAAILRSRMPSDATAKNLAITLFFAEDRESNGFHRCSYDLQSLYNDRGLWGGLVINLLRTGEGTCRSLPYLFRILAEELNAPSYIACAPMHFYIKHLDNKGVWWCYETTAYTYCDEQRICQLNMISNAAKASGFYAKPLSDKENLCLCLYDLIYFYEKKTGFYSNAFVRKCYSLGLKYHPVSMLHICELNDKKYQMDKLLWLRGGKGPEDIALFPDLQLQQDSISKIYNQLKTWGYYAYSPEEIQNKMKQIKEIYDTH